MLQGTQDRNGAPPRALKVAMAAAAVLLLAGGLLLIAGRGEAMLIDLYSASARFFCL